MVATVTLNPVPPGQEVQVCVEHLTLVSRPTVKEEMRFPGPSGSEPGGRMHSLLGGKVRMRPSPDAPDHLREEAEARDSDRSTARWAYTDPPIPTETVPLPRGLDPGSWGATTTLAAGGVVPMTSPRASSVLLNPVDMTPPPPPVVLGYEGYISAPPPPPVGLRTEHIQGDGDRTGGNTTVA